MSFTLETVLLAEKEEKNNLLLEHYLELETDLAFFNARLLELQIIFSEAPQLKKRELYDEIQIVTQLIETIKAYTATLKSTTTLGFKVNKLNEEDLTVLDAQVRGVKALRKLISTDTKTMSKKMSASLNENDVVVGTPCDSLSRLIDDTREMTYNISTARRWLRRSALVLGSLISGLVALAAVAVLMTPGVNIMAAAVMVPTMLASAAAFVYLRKPVVTHEPVNLGSFHTSVAAAVPSSLGVITAAGMGVSSFKKLPITNRPREVTARNTQTATMNLLIETLKQKINAMPIEHITLKEFLKSAVKRASLMYNEGMDSWFAETRLSKTLKGRLILSEIAKIFERDDFEQLTVDIVLEQKVSNSGYTLEHLLNAQRNPLTFWKQKTNTMKLLLERGVVLERNPVSLSLCVFANTTK